MGRNGLSLDETFYIHICFILTGVTSVCAQHACCQPADRAFAGLADDPRFVMQHDEPVPVTLHDEAGTMVSFQPPMGKMPDAYVVRPDRAGSNFLIVFHEWWVFNDHIIQMADQLAADLKDVTVIAVDLYDGQVAATREDAASAMQSMSTERGIHIIREFSSWFRTSTQMNSPLLLP